MTRIRNIFLVLIGVSLLGASGASAADPLDPRSTIEGRWRLVEQTYGSGQANRADSDAPLHLEFHREAGRLIGRSWFGAGDAARWPSLPVGESRALSVERVDVARDEASVLAHYRVEPAPGDDATLEITEEYRVTEGGSVLSGRVTVAVSRGGEPGGSYVLHRKFKRER